MDDNIRSQAIALYDRFTHDGMDRRDFFAAMTRLAGGVAAANVLIGSIAASPAAASIVPADDKRRRLNALLALQEGIGLERNRAWLGREVEVLVDSLVSLRGARAARRDLPVDDCPR